MPSTANMSVNHFGSSILGATVYNTMGYAAGSIAGAAVAGSAASIIAASALGGAVLYIPTMLLRECLKQFELMNSLISEALNLAYFAGSAATGAMLLGLTIKPLLICAAVGIIVRACLNYFYTSPQTWSGVVGGAIINYSILNELGYEGACLVGADAATMVGAGTMLGVTALGTAAIFLPVKILKKALMDLDLMNKSVGIAIDLVLPLGSAVAGAALMGLAVQPVAVCAGIGILINACLLAILESLKLEKVVKANVGRNQSSMYGRNSKYAERGYTVEEPNEEPVYFPS